MTELRWILLIAGVALVVGLYLWGTRERRSSGAGERLRYEPRRSAPPAELPRVEPKISLQRDDADVSDAPTPASRDERPPAVPPPRREPGLAQPVAARPDAAQPGSPTRAEPLVRGAARAEPVLTERAGGPTAERASTSPPAEGAPVAPSGARPPQKIVALRVTAAHPARFDGGQLRDVLMAAGFVHGRYDIFHRLDREGRPVISLASLLEPGTFDPATMASAAYPGIALFTVMPGPLPATRAFDELLDTARSIAHRIGGHLQDDRGAPLSVQRVFALREEVLAFERSLGSVGAG